MANPVPQTGSAPFTPRRAARRELPVAVVGLTLVVLGAVAQLVALMAMPWVKATTAKATVQLHFNDFWAHAERGWAYMYFSWGAWVLLALSAALGAVACLHWRHAHPFRVAGAVVGVVGAFAVVAAVLVFAYQTHAGVFQVARNYTVGVYLEILGLLATAIGAAAGSAGVPLGEAD